MKEYGFFGAIVALILGGLIFTFIRISTIANQQTIKQKQNYSDCLTKTSGNFDWCYDRFISN